MGRALTRARPAWLVAAVALAACHRDPPPPRFSVASDPCHTRAAVHVAHGADSVRLGFGGGFPGEVVEGTLERNGRFVGHVGATANGPGPGMDLRVEVCVDAAPLFAAVDRGEAPGSAPAMEDAPAEWSDRLNCVVAVTTGGVATPVPDDRCHFVADAPRTADAIFQRAAAIDASPPACAGGSAWCSATFEGGTAPYVHDSFPSYLHRAVLSRDGRLACHRDVHTVLARVAGAAALVDWLADGSTLHGVSIGADFDAYDGVFLVRGGVTGFLPAGSDGGPVVARFRRVQRALPWACRIP